MDGHLHCARLLAGLVFAAALIVSDGAAAAEMVEAILKDKKKILPCSVYLQGEYGVKNQFLGVPVKLGAKGLEQIIEIKLEPEEQAALMKSAAVKLPSARTPFTEPPPGGALPNRNTTIGPLTPAAARWMWDATTLLMSATSSR